MGGHHDYDNLLKIVEEAYEKGLTGSLEAKDVIIEDILLNNSLKENHEIRVYSIYELSGFPVGTSFHHTMLGKGKITQRRDIRDKYMSFDCGVSLRFSVDSCPWDLPMAQVE